MVYDDEDARNLVNEYISYRDDIRETAFQEMNVHSYHRGNKEIINLSWVYVNCLLDPNGYNKAMLARFFEEDGQLKSIEGVSQGILDSIQKTIRTVFGSDNELKNFAKNPNIQHMPPQEHVAEFLDAVKNHKEQPSRTPSPTPKPQDGGRRGPRPKRSPSVEESTESETTSTTPSQPNTSPSSSPATSEPYNAKPMPDVFPGHAEPSPETEEEGQEGTTSMPLEVLIPGAKIPDTYTEAQEKKKKKKDCDTSGLVDGVVDKVQLEEACKKFLDVPGAWGKDGPLTKLYDKLKIGSVIVLTPEELKALATAVKGYMFELQVALRLEKRKRTVVRFGLMCLLAEKAKEFNSDTKKFKNEDYQEFDIVTQDNAFIECKNIQWSRHYKDWNDKDKRLKKQMVRQLGASLFCRTKHDNSVLRDFRYEIHSANQISDEWKKLIKQLGISYIADQYCPPDCGVLNLE